MLDSNIFDRLDRDPELVSILQERKDLRLYISDVQMAELAAIHEEEKQKRLVRLAKTLCFTVSSKTVLPEVEPKHRADASIAGLSLANCDALVSEDEGLLTYAKSKGIKAINFNTFIDRYNILS